MIKILFVCHGNICRSPMAEYVLRDMVKKRGIGEEFEISSSATSTEEIGNPVYPPARRMLESHGIACAGHRARQMTKADYEYYDKIICMDKNNIRNALRITGSDDKGKLSLMLDHALGRRGDVADPWYTDDFEATWRDVNDGCQGLLNELGY